MTHNRPFYIEASTIAFHGSMFHVNLKDLPPVEDAQHPKKASVMNKSDVIETCFGSRRTGNLRHLKSTMATPAYTIQEKNHFGEEKEKETKGSNHNSRALAPIAWIVSNYKANNKRHYFVMQLQKRIPVDIYGRAQCTSNK
ncbi:hypothetical protein BGZ88_003547 [Linnemannia elongata]|nr:hypothetical protein BGZ88_003547 [Linnemannia elongata]